MKEREREREAPGGFRTHDLSDTRHVLYRRATTAALIVDLICDPSMTSLPLLLKRFLKKEHRRGPLLTFRSSVFRQTFSKSNLGPHADTTLPSCSKSFKDSY